MQTTDDMKAHSIREAAAMVGISRSTFLKLVADGQGPTITRVGARRTVVFDRHLRAWIDQLPQH